MKVTIASLALLFSTFYCLGAAPQPAAKAVAYDVHNGYFVSNQFEPDATTSFVVIRDQVSFDKVFGTGMVMGDKSNRLVAEAFKNEMVVAAIHRGNAMVTYEVQSVALEGTILVVRYKSEGKTSDSASFACPLILSIEKKEFTGVRFIENGKTIKQLAVEMPTKKKS